MIKTIDDVKSKIIQTLKDIEFDTVDSLSYESNKKLSNIWKHIRDNMEINFALDKEGDKDCFEIIAYKDVDEGVQTIKLYGSYVDLLMGEKSEKDYIKHFIFHIIERIEQSFNKGE